MKKVFILTILLLMLAGTVSAYELILDCPASLQRGDLLVVNGTSNLPAGTTLEVLFSNTEFRTNEPMRKSVTIQGYDNKSFSVVFETQDLKRGIYKVEIPPTGGYSFLGNSVSLRVVEIIDRSNEIEIKSPLTQYLTGPGGNILKIAGIGHEQKDDGLQMEVIGPGGTIFGPSFISTSMDGSFSKEFSVHETGTYVVKFADAKGDLGTVNFTMIEDIPATVQGTVMVTMTEVPTQVSASAESSRDVPACFAVTTGSGPVKVYTSKGTDWVVEYVDANGTLQKINQMGQLSEEVVTVQGNGDVMYFIVYPFKYIPPETVTLFAENAGKIEATTNIPAIFGTSTTTQTSVTTTKQSPVPVIVFVAALAITLLAAWRYRR